MLGNMPNSIMLIFEQLAKSFLAYKRASMVENLWSVVALVCVSRLCPDVTEQHRLHPLPDSHFANGRTPYGEQV